MKEISCKELKQRLDREEDFKLVNCLSEIKFQKLRIPGSINFPVTPEGFANPAELQKELSAFFDQRDDIVVYCTDEKCQASIFIYNQLETLGYEKIARFSGGLAEWDADGYELISG